MVSRAEARSTGRDVLCQKWRYPVSSTWIIPPSASTSRTPVPGSISPIIVIGRPRRADSATILFGSNGCGKQQLVIVAAARERGWMPGSASTTVRAAADSGSGPIDARSDLRSFADVAEIGQKTVRDIDHRARDAAQQRAEFGARIGQAEAADQMFAMLGRQFPVASAQHPQPEKRIANRAGDPYKIARLGAAAPDFRACRDLADGGQRQDRRTVGGDRVAAQQVDPETG